MNTTQRWKTSAAISEAVFDLSYTNMKLSQKTNTKPYSYLQKLAILENLNEK